VHVQACAWKLIVWLSCGLDDMSGTYDQQQAVTASLLGGAAAPPTGTLPPSGTLQQQQQQQQGAWGIGAAATPTGTQLQQQQQQAATASLLGPANAFGTPIASQQAATSGLLGVSTPGAAGALTGAQPYGAMAAPVTPLMAMTEPGPGMASFNAQQEATAMLMNPAMSMNPAGTTPAGVGGTFAAQQEATAMLMNPAGTTPTGVGGAFAAQQEATAQLLGAGGTPSTFQAQQEATARLLNPGAATRTEVAQDVITQRLLGGEGLRARTTAGGALSAKRAAAARAETNTRFALVLNGEIQSAQLGSGGRGPLMCVFSMQHGADWTIVSGASNGITQLATSSLPPVTSASSALFRGGDPREVVWNFPIGLVFKSTSPFGWPRIVVTVYGTDLCNRRVIKGYGSVHIPCQPGRHTRTVRLYCPLSSSPLTRLLGALFGNPAQLVDPRIVAGTEGREVIRVQSGGKVRLNFDVLLKDTETFNYSF